MNASRGTGMRDDWIELGTTPPAELADARLQVHYAGDLVTAPARALLPPAPDDSQTNLGWIPRLRALASRELPGTRPCRVALNVASLQLSLLDESDSRIETLSLANCSLDRARRWVRQRVELRTGRTLSDAFHRSPYALPPHAVAAGADFSGEPVEAFQELARWFGTADPVLAGVAARHQEASEIRCWPHHCDIATLLTVEREDGAARKAVGVGLSPGDANYPEPYWYVAPWPYPERRDFPDLPGGGHWHLEGFTAAILTGTRLLEVASSAGRQERLEGFLEAAIAAAQAVLAESSDADT